MRGFILEKGSENIPLTRSHLLVEPTIDMSEIEFWESRLSFIGQEYAIAYKKRKGKYYYAVFTKQGASGSKFR